MQLRWTEVRVDLVHAFTIAHGTSDHRVNIAIQLEHEGKVGLGLAAPNPRYGETPASTVAALAKIACLLPESPWLFQDGMQDIDAIPGAYAAKAALEMAMLDWVGKVANCPLYRLFGIDPGKMPPTSMTIGIDTLERVKEKVRQVPQFEVLKVKLDGENDRALISAIREVTTQTLRVDANEGWRDPEQAAREIDWLAGQGVELVEQPMPAEQTEAMAWLKPRSALPLIADESFHGHASAEALRDGFHGINIKLMKCGGLLQARRWITLARYFDLKIMLGCMVASCVSIAAAAQIAPEVDFVDLDGHLLIANDPFEGLGLHQGRLVPGVQPGLGVAIKKETHLSFRQNI